MGKSRVRAERRAGEGLQAISYRIPFALAREGIDTVRLLFDALFKGETSDHRSHAVSFYLPSIELVSLPEDAR